MEHIEEAGIHSGDSRLLAAAAFAAPRRSLAELDRQTRELALALDVGGLMNVQFAIKDDVIYVLEVNPRASRTVPFVAKVIGIPVAKIAARDDGGRELLASFGLEARRASTTSRSRKRSFPFARFPGVDTVLGPEMRSTGEVMGLDRDYAVAFAKSQLGAGIAGADRRHGLRLGARRRQAAQSSRADPAARRARLPRHRHLAARSASSSSRASPAAKVNKVLEGRPHIVDAITNGEVQLALQHHRGRPGARRQPLAPAGRPLAQSPILHHASGCRCGDAGHQSLPRGRP